MWIKNNDDLDKSLDNGAYTNVGGYPIYFISQDMGCLCYNCVKDNLMLVKEARENFDKQWNVIAVDVNYETKDMFCDNCEREIESAYADEE